MTVSNKMRCGVVGWVHPLFLSHEDECRFQEFRSEQQIYAFNTATLFTLVLYLISTAIKGLSGYQLIYRTFMVLQWVMIASACLTFRRWRRMLRFYDSITVTITMWNNSYMILAPRHLATIFGSGWMGADAGSPECTSSYTQLLPLLHVAFLRR